MPEIANNVPDGISDTTTGETVNAYTDALNWSCLGFSTKMLYLKNTDLANALKYKVVSYAFKDGNVHEEVVETILAAGAFARLSVTAALAQVKIQVKSSVGDAHATFRVDFAGNR